MRLLFVFVFLLGLVSCGGEEERITEHNISTFKTFYEDGKIKSKKTGFIPDKTDGYFLGYDFIGNEIHFFKNGKIKKLVVDYFMNENGDTLSFKGLEGKKVKIKWQLECDVCGFEPKLNSFEGNWNKQGYRIGQWYLFNGKESCNIEFYEKNPYKTNLNIPKSYTIQTNQLKKHRGRVRSGHYEDWKKSSEIRKELDSCFEWKDYKKILSEYGIIEKKLNSLDKLAREKIIDSFH